jgi:flagellin
MRINHNIAALNTHRQLNSATNAQAKSMEKLSSGLRINRAGDDAAGLAISEKMRGQIRGLDQASRNAQDGISLIQTAEGALNETHDILQRMRELATQSSNDTNTTTDREELQKEMNQLTEEINRISSQTEFNTQKLLDGATTGGAGSVSLNLQIGANATQSFNIDIENMGAQALGIAGTTGGDATLTGSATTNGVTITTNDQTVSADATFQTANTVGKAYDGSTDVYALDITDHDKATAAIKVVDKAIESVSAERSKLGAYQNRLEHTINNLNTSSENLTAAESRIRDVDMAKEMMASTKNSILSQAAQAMLAQANQQPQGVLQLLR